MTIVSNEVLGFIWIGHLMGLERRKWRRGQRCGLLVG